MSNHETSDLTGFEEPSPERLAYLERDRWPEFERELRTRRPRKIRFDFHHFGAEPGPWEWLVCRCRTWEEVGQVLNRQRVGWERKAGRIEMDGMNIYRCA